MTLSDTYHRLCSHYYSHSSSSLSIIYILREQLSGIIWILLYFLANLTMTIHNKWVLDRLQFHFPILLTALHIAVSGIGAHLVLLFYPREGSFDRTPLIAESGSRIPFKGCLTLLMFSFIYTINIAMSNISLNQVSLVFHQIVRSSTPALVVPLEFFILRKHFDRWAYVSLIPVCAGVALATMGEMDDVHFDFSGTILTIIGVALAALKGVVTNVLLVGPLKFTPLDLLRRMAPAAFIQCLVYAVIFGEASRLPAYFSAIMTETTLKRPSPSILPILIINGLFAFFLNYVSFTANKYTSPLSMTVAGNVKQALSILLAVYLFQTPITPLKCLGIMATIMGGAWYSAVSYRCNSAMTSTKEKSYISLGNTDSSD